MTGEELINAGVEAIIGEARAKPDAKPTMSLSKMDPLVRLLFESAATDFNVELVELLAAGRGVRRVAKARMVVIWVLSKFYGMSLNEIADEIARDRTTIRHAVVETEKLRESDEVIRAYLDKFCEDIEELRVEVLGGDGNDLI